MFLNLIDKKLFDDRYFLFLAFSYYVILYSTLLRQDPTFKKVDFKKTQH